MYEFSNGQCNCLFSHVNVYFSYIGLKVVYEKNNLNYKIHYQDIPIM